MKSHKKLLSLILVISILFCCLTNLFVMASDIDVSGYTYVVDNMTFYKGDKQIDSLDGITEVAVDVTRRVAGEDSDRLIISTYSATGEYIGMYSVTHYIDFGKTSTVKVLLNVPEGKTVGEIKAFVWKSFSDMTPLSNVLSSENNMIIDPKFEYDKELQTSFTDVSVNDTFADAVSLMAYLGIMNGYEDGTFRPTTNLRVADAARLITYMTKGQASASILESEDLVSDEIPSSIEKGYINYCVDAGYLIPDENGYVNYNENITTAEFLKLTVNALGYSNLANVSGGWPRGYVSVATQYGIADVSDLNYSAPITRSTAAEILYSAINAPIAQIVGYTYDASGALVPKIEIQDGVQSSYYQSMLTQNFNIYSIDGYVVATQKDNTGLKADEVDFAIAKTKKYNQDDLCILNAAGKVDNVNTLFEANVAGRILSRVNVGDTNAADYKGTYATAYVKFNENNEWEFVKFIPSDKNIVHTFDLKDIDDADYALTSTAPYLKFFVDDATISTKYLLDPVGVAVYVNGVKVWGTPIVDYVINGDVGEVKLVDTYKSDGKIDTIYVDKFVSGMFDGISSSGRVSFKSPDAGLSYIVLDDEDESLEYNIYYNGEAITVDDLKKDDVLTIAYDVTATSVKDSNFYDIYVSRDIVTGTLKGKDNDEKAAKFGDTYYPFATDAKFTSFASAKLGDEYTLYLDAFGRIFKAEQNTSAANWAIVEKFTLATADDDYKLTMFTAEGETKAYYFDANSASVTLADGSVINKTTAGSIDALNNAVKALVYSSGTTKKTIDQRVIQYKVKASNSKINELKFMGVQDDTIDTSVTPNTTKEEYSERRNAIGTIKLGDATKIVDATKYVREQELTTTSYASLIDEVEYRAYAYGTKIEGIYPFVLITEGEAVYNKRTRFAVITEDGCFKETDEKTGDIIYTIKAMYGESNELVVSDDISTTALNNLKKGEVILFETNSEGEVRRFDKLTEWSDAMPAQKELASGSLVDNNVDYTNLTALTINDCMSYNFSSDFTHDWDDISKDAIKIVYGPIMERTAHDITFGKVDANCKTNTVSDISIFDFAEDVRVYSYDYQESDLFEYNGSDISAIIPTYISEENMEDNGITVDWNKTVDGTLVNQKFANFAFAIVVDDAVQDIFTFITDSDIIIPDSSDEEITFNESFAIAEKFTLSVEDDDYKLTMFTAEGETKAYYFDANRANVTLADGTVINKTTEGSVDALNTAVKALVYSSGTTKKAIEDRVIQYKVSSSSGMITELKFMAVKDSTDDSATDYYREKEEYSARKNAIGTIKLSEATKIIDATKYVTEKELSPATSALLTDGVEYKAYAYGTTINGIYPFVLITEGQAAYTAATRFAVVTEDGYAEDMDDETGDIIYTISAMYGDADKLVVSDDISTTTLSGLKKGEVILFKTNPKGQIYYIDKLTSWSGVPTQAALAAGSLVENNTIYSNLTALTINNLSGGNFSSDFTHDWDSSSRDAIKVVYGPVMQRTDSDIAFGKVDGLGKTNTDTEVSIFGFSDDIRVYTYDYAKGEKYRFEYQDKATSAISVTNLLETSMEYDGYTVDWNRDSDLDGWKENQESVTFAFAIVVNDEVQDIFAFLHK